MSVETDLIRLQMQETRTGLVEKLDTLEQRVTSTVADAQAAVTDTVENVKETVAAVKGSVRDSVDALKNAVDVSRQVERHPWLSMGAAVAVGYLGGRLLQPPPRKATTNGADGFVAAASGPIFQRQGPPEGEKPAKTSLRPAAPSRWDRLAGTFQKEIDEVRSLAIGVTAGLVRDAVVAKLTDPLRPRVQQVFDDVTEKLGGEVFHEPLFDRLFPNSPQRKETVMQSATQQKWQGRWEQFTGRVKKLWGTVTDNDLKQVQGDYERALGVIKERTGESREDIERKLDALKEA